MFLFQRLRIVPHSAAKCGILPTNVGRRNMNILKHSKSILPSVGLGTWGSDYFSAEQIANSVKIAINECNYKHIDCASVYNNQTEIGHALNDCFENNNINRKSIHITSKIWNNEQYPESKVIESIEKTLKELQTDYIDLCLIHWPFRNHHAEGAPSDGLDSNATAFDITKYMQTWTALNELCDQKLIGNIGVSNMTIKKLKDMFKCIGELNSNNYETLRYPSVNQIEIHPYFQQNELVEFCKMNGITVTASMPLGSPQRPDRDRSDDDPDPLVNSVLKEMSEQLDCSIAQVIIAWHVNRGLCCVPKAIDKWMIQQNIDAMDIVLNQEQMKKIEQIDRNHRFTKGQVFRWYQTQKWQELWDE